MSKVGELSQTVEEIRQCGQTLIGIADALTSMYSEAEETPAPEPEPEPKEEIKFEVLRAVLAKKTRVSKENTDAIRDLIKSLGASRLSEVKKEDYAALMAEAEVLPDA